MATNNINTDEFVTVLNPDTNVQLQVKKDSPLITREVNPFPIVSAPTKQSLTDERNNLGVLTGQPSKIIIPKIGGVPGETLEVPLGDNRIKEAFKSVTGTDKPVDLLTPAQIQDSLNKAVAAQATAAAAKPDVEIPEATQQQKSLFQQASQVLARELTPEGDLTTNAIIAKSLENIRSRANVQSQRRIANAKKTAEAINQVLDEDLEQIKKTTERSVESIDISSDRRRDLLQKSKDAAVGRLELEKQSFDNQYAALVAEAEEKEEERRIKAETANGLLGTFGSSAANQNLRTEAQKGQRLIFNLKQARIIGGKNFAIDIAETIESFANQIDNLEQSRQEAKQAAYDNLLARTSDIRKNRILAEADKNKAIDDAIAQYDKVNFEVDLRISDSLKEQVAEKVRLAQDLIERDIEMTREQQERAFDLITKDMEQEFELEKLGIVEQRKRDEFAVKTDIDLEKLDFDKFKFATQQEQKRIMDEAEVQLKLSNLTLAERKQALAELKFQTMSPLEQEKLRAEIAKLKRLPAAKGSGGGALDSTQTNFIQKLSASYVNGEISSDFARSQIDDFFTTSKKSDALNTFIDLSEASTQKIEGEPPASVFSFLGDILPGGNKSKKQDEPGFFGKVESQQIEQEKLRNESEAEKQMRLFETLIDANK